MQPAIDMMRLLMPLYFTNTIRQILTGVLRAYKKSSGPMILSIAWMVVLRQICLAVTKLMGQKIIHVYISYPLGWISAFLFVLAYYIYEMKKIRRNKTTQWSGFRHRRNKQSLVNFMDLSEKEASISEYCKNHNTETAYGDSERPQLRSLKAGMQSWTATR